MKKFIFAVQCLSVFSCKFDTPLIPTGQAPSLQKQILFFFKHYQFVQMLSQNESFVFAVLITTAIVAAPILKLWPEYEAGSMPSWCNTDISHPQKQSLDNGRPSCNVPSPRG